MSILPHPVIADGTELSQVKPKKVSTGEVLLRVMQEDNRYVNNLLESAPRNKPLFSPSSMLAFVGLGGALAAVFSIVTAFKERNDKDLDELEGEVDLAKADGHTEEKIDEEAEKFSIKKLWDDLVGKKGSSTEPPQSTAAQAKPISNVPGALKESPIAKTAPTIPPSKLAKPSADVQKALKRVAANTGSDYSTLYAFAGSESSFRSTAQASTSSAVGLLQFTAPTWNYLIAGPFKHLGYKTTDRTDPEKSATMASLYIERIRQTLRKNLGHEPSIGEIYVGYVMGPTGGSRFLAALMKDPKAIAADLFPKEAAANKGLFYAGSRALSLQEAYDKMSGKVNSYYAQSKTENSASTVVASGTKPSQDEAHLAPTAKPTTASTSPGAPTVAASTGKAKPIALTVSPTEVSARADRREEEIYGNTPATEQPQVADTSPPIRQAPNYIRDKQGRLISIPA